jgi:hypothetical protein
MKSELDFDEWDELIKPAPEAFIQCGRVDTQIVPTLVSTVL